MAEPTDRLPPPPFWRTPYFAFKVMARPDRHAIEFADILRAIAEPARTDR
jgi:hypothetical protein